MWVAIQTKVWDHTMFCLLQKSCKSIWEVLTPCHQAVHPPDSPAAIVELCQSSCLRVAGKKPQPLVHNHSPTEPSLSCCRCLTLGPVSLSVADKQGFLSWCLAPAAPKDEIPFPSSPPPKALAHNTVFVMDLFSSTWRAQKRVLFYDKVSRVTL